MGLKGDHDAQGVPWRQGSYPRRGFYRRPVLFRPIMRPWGMGLGRRRLWMGGGMLAFMLFGCLFLAALMILR